MLTTEIKKARCTALVIALVGTASSTWWWNSPNKAFSNLSPLEMFEQDPDRVYNYLMFHGNVGGGS